MVRLVLLLAAMAIAPGAAAQTLYKYQDKNGRWQFADKPPADGRQVETRTLNRELLSPRVLFEREETGAGVALYAVNQFHGPVELEIRLSRLVNVSAETPLDFQTLLPADSRTAVLELAALDPANRVRWTYAARYMIGDPKAEHRPPGPYRAPYALGDSHRVSQAWPVQTTHGLEGAHHAIDIAMPVGTPLHAARAGTVLAIAYDSYSGGTDRARDGPKANLVRILHDDGTMAVYAHLQWESIRVRPGQRVGVGEYIADSGNTGYSSGPHLHFAVERNTGMRLEAVPVEFRDLTGGEAPPATGKPLTAW